MIQRDTDFWPYDTHQIQSEQAVKEYCLGIIVIILSLLTHYKIMVHLVCLDLCVKRLINSQYLK